MLNKKFLSAAITLFVSIISFSQVYDPVDWSFSVEQNGSEATLILTATIEDSWHIYSQTVNPDEGPIPTSFIFTENPNFSKNGSTSEQKPHVEYDQNFAMDLAFFDTKAVFKQKININSDTDFKISGSLEFMCCNDEMCLPPTMVDFEFDLKGKLAKTSVPEEEKKKDESEGLEQNSNEDIAAPAFNGESSSLDENQNNSNLVEPVKWTYSANKISDSEYEIIFNAKIEQHWHLYAQKLESNDGPIPTSFRFDTIENILLAGTPFEKGKKVTEFDPTFNMNSSFFENQVSFIQKITVSKGHPDIISGSLEYMSCDDSKCVFPSPIDFKISLSGKEILEESTNTISEGVIPTLENLDLKNPVNDCGGTSLSSNENEEQESWWVYLLWGIGGGFVALLTPCVYPMIPLTVSFFTKGESKPKATGIRDAVLYGFFIFLIYILVSLPFHLSNADPELLNKIATGATLNIIFFVVFVFFAFSFFGYYELTLPSKWGNKVDSASNVGGFIGIFLMAMTLAIVSFSCTGPILGSVLAKVLKFGPMPLTYTLAGFGLALGLPFAIFAAAPNLMKSLPTSGGWMNSVKVVLGFLELGLALKFLSNADLVEQWGLIKREVFIGIWIVLGLGLTAYLLGLIRFPHDSKVTKLSFPRIGFAILALAFTIYLIPGLTCGEYSNRALISGFPPPMSQSFCNQSDMAKNNEDFKIKVLHTEHELDEGLKKAKEENKPILLDFTGWACVNCRKVEENIWVDSAVNKKLYEDFIIISLYVDDRRELPSDQQGEVDITYSDGSVKKKKIKTIGDKWSTFEILSFENNSQPRYAVIHPNGKLLTPPIGYADIVKNGYSEYYNDYLQCGLDAFEKVNN